MRKSRISIGVILLAATLVMLLAPQVLLLAFAAVLLAVFLRGGGDWIAARLGLPAGAGLLIFCLLLLGLAALFFARAARGLAEQFAQLLAQLPAALDQVRATISQHGWAQEMLSSFDLQRLLPSGSGAMSTVSSTIGVFGNSVLLLFIGLYLAVAPRLYRKGAALLFAPPLRPRVRMMLSEAGHALRSWLMAQLVAMMVIGLLTFAGLWALGIPLAAILAVLSALLTFIPNIGPILAAIPAILLALSQGVSTALTVTALYIAVQAVESYLVTPRLQQEAVSLPPALTIIFQLLMGTLFGIMGLALATPMMAVILTLTGRHYVRDYLEAGEPPERLREAG